ncbi:spermatogenesis-associated protein 7 homolog isoform X2 [Mercenaria mercenaria]|uniref:spermatogenesis-associated protein 7 homolog isoform X2 n=1 Tax=Mercenaria mercenaria TaxID=6596 RepID=UPI00234E4244|nr:spermatogenesis-associated protein 7 homolog isoform X2 [Mercenaria mercenaria]
MGVHGGDTAMKSSNSLRGQMGLRSGPLAPTSAKLTTQYLVLDHMNNHYSKITKARPAIDNKPPKSMSTSQKARDRKTRDVVQKTGRRPMSATKSMSRPHTTTGYYQDEDIYNENLWGEVDPEDEEEMMIHNIMRTTLRGNDPVSTQAMHGSDPNQNPNDFSPYARVRQRPSSARSQRSMGSAVSRTMVQVPSKKGTYDGDILEKRSQVFTEQKPFTPRTLKTDRKSRLSQYKYYNKLPPKEAKSKSREDAPEQTTEKKQVEPTTETRPQPKPRNIRLDRTREGPVTMNSLMFETLHSRDFSKYDDKNGQNSDIPKLDISMDTDHLKWIKEQASKAKVRSSSDTMKSTVREEDPYDQSVDFGKTGEMSLTYGTLGSTKTRPPLGTSKKMTPEDEEAMYVRFMRDVTNEVLDRGIYTDRALRQVFKAHIARNKGHLDELRMHEILDNIRKELDIPRYDIDDDTSLSMTQDTEPFPQNGMDSTLEKYMSPDFKPSKFRGHDTIDNEAGMSGTLETSMKSRASKVSTEQSADSYPFKSTEDDELYSTIRSDMNNTANLTDTLALKTYQMSINEQEELEEGEVNESHEEGEVTPREQGEVNARAISTADNSTRVSEDEEEDDYDDDYEDEGDDEDDGHHTTEPTATYRTDDDDDF